MMIYFRLLLAVICTMSTTALYSQSTCPPDTGTNCDEWSYGNYQTTTENPDCNLIVSYHWRNCDGNYQIYIDLIVKAGNCEYLNDQGTMSAFMEWLNLVLIEEIANLNGEYPPAICPDSSQKAIFYNAPCGLWVKCEYNVDPANRVCDADWRGPYPDTDTSGISKVAVWKWQACGLACCKKTYSICKTVHPDGLNYDIHIRSVSKQRVGDCSNPQNFVKPCEDGC